MVQKRKKANFVKSSKPLDMLVGNFLLTWQKSKVQRGPDYDSKKAKAQKAIIAQARDCLFESLKAGKAVSSMTQVTLPTFVGNLLEFSIDLNPGISLDDATACLERCCNFSQLSAEVAPMKGSGFDQGCKVFCAYTVRLTA